MIGCVIIRIVITQPNWYFSPDLQLQGQTNNKYQGSQSMISKSENRVGQQPVPDNVHMIMNPEQVLIYRGMQAFGWNLKFVRRPLFQRPVFVMAHPEIDEVAVIEESGAFNKDHGIKLREMEVQAA